MSTQPDYFDQFIVSGIYDVKNINSDRGSPVQTSNSDNTNSEENNSQNRSRGKKGKKSSQDNISKNQQKILFDYFLIDGEEGATADIGLPRQGSIQFLSEIVVPNQYSRFKLALVPQGPFKISVSNFPDSLNLIPPSTLECENCNDKKYSFITTVRAQSKVKKGNNYELFVKDLSISETICSLSIESL